MREKKKKKKKKRGKGVGGGGDRVFIIYWFSLRKVIHWTNGH